MSKHPDEPKIYLLPNLMTAGNLCCGFLAILSIFEGMQKGNVGGEYDFNAACGYYQNAIYLIFGSCIFDLLDGRLARLGGQESPFGQEFDSITDVVSFGVAPALLVSRSVLFGLEVEKLSWAIAFVYLLCGAMRLARFNCLANMPKETQDSSNFRGIPIPMAAGFIGSLTFLMIHFKDHGDLGIWNWVLAVAALGIALLMISNVKYPSFKKVGWKTKSSLPTIVIIALVLMIFITQEKVRWFMPTAIFSIYLLYGLFKPIFGKRKKSEEQAVSVES